MTSPTFLAQKKTASVTALVVSLIIIIAYFQFQNFPKKKLHS